MVMTSRHTNPAIYAGLAGAAAWACPTCADALTVFGADVSLSQPGVSFALGCFVGAAVACGTSAVVTHAAEVRRERERAEQAVEAHAARARKARAEQDQARMAEHAAYVAAQNAQQKIAYAEAMEAKQAEAEAALCRAREAEQNGAERRVAPQTTAQFVMAAQQSAARAAGPQSTAQFVAAAQRGSSYSGARQQNAAQAAPQPARRASAADPQAAPSQAAGRQPQFSRGARQQGAPAGQNAQASQPAPRYTVPSHYGVPGAAHDDPWELWQADANADYLDVAEDYVNRITLRDRMAARAKGVAGVLAERLGSSKMEGLPVIARADGSVGDVGEQWWNNAVGDEVRPVGEGIAGLRGVNESMAANSAVLFTTQTVQQAQAAKGAWQAQQRAAQAGAAPSGQPYASAAAQKPARPAAQRPQGAARPQQASPVQATAAGQRPVAQPVQANVARPDQACAAHPVASQVPPVNVAFQQAVRPGAVQAPQARATAPSAQPSATGTAPSAQRPVTAAAPQGAPRGVAAQPSASQPVPRAARPANSQPLSAARPAQTAPAQGGAGQPFAARTDRETIAARLGDPKVAFPDKKATRWSDEQQDLWQVALAALDERTNEEIALRAASDPMPLVTSSSYDELDEPDHIEPATQFMAFKPQAGKPDVVDAESYVDMLVDQELSKSESPAVRKLAKHGIRDFFRVVDGGTHGFRPTSPTKPGSLALQA